MRILNKIDIEFASEVLSGTSLFKGTNTASLRACIETGGFIPVEYDADEVILSPVESEKKMVVFLSGQADVYSADEHRAMILRTVGRGGVVGVANLFSEESFVSRVIAAKKSSVLEISAEKYGKIIEKDSRAMFNYVSFLSNRICYLNKKIVCLTAGSAERRLAYFLDSSLSELYANKEENEICVQMNSLCEMLNLGRASLYRAADRLCEEGFILREGKKIKVIDRQGMMERYR